MLDKHKKLLEEIRMTMSSNAEDMWRDDEIRAMLNGNAQLIVEVIEALENYELLLGYKQIFEDVLELLKESKKD